MSLAPSDVKGNVHVNVLEVLQAGC